MIRPLRAAHRIVWVLLALALPALLALALTRRHTTVETPLPPQLAPTTGGH
ncbi:MAG: hypothetical protein ABI609_18445 [Acidobacteriota bacterium]